MRTRCLLRPVVVTSVALTKGFSLNRVVLALKSIVEFVSETTEVLSLNHNVDVIGAVLGLTVSVILGQILFVTNQTRVNLNLTRLHMGEFSKLSDVIRGTGVARLLVREQISSDTVVRIVAASGDILSSVSNAADWVRANFNIAGRGQAHNHSFK
jgi:hypothetical protein